MRVVIDLQGAQTPGSRNRGIGRYTTSLTEAILRNRGGHDVHLALNGSFGDSIDELRARFGTLLPQSNIHVWQQLPSVAHNIAGGDARRIASQNLREYFIRQLRPDVVHISSLFEGLVDDGVCSIGNLYGDAPTSVTLYDLIPLINPREYLADPAVSAWYMDCVDHLRRADSFLAISESARQEAIDYLGAPANVSINVGTAADQHFKILDIPHEQEHAIRRKFGLPRPFVMYTGGVDTRKNIERLVAAYAGIPKPLRAKHQLAIVCAIQERDRKRLQQLGRSKGLTNDELVMTGFVSDEELVSLYNLAKLFVFPSWHEGFGLPALEAMQCGAAVISSDRSSLPEVVGIREAMFDPFDESQIRDRIRSGLEDEDYREFLLANAKRQVGKFDWDECGKRAVAVFERMHQICMRPSSSPDHRPRLAYVSPMPPARTGIADYSAELLSELTRHYRVDVIAKNSAVSEVDFPLAPQTIPVIGASQFEENWRQYDRILYHFGNSHQHDYMFPLLEQTSGVVVLHDFYLSGVVSYREAHHQPAHGWSDELYRSHGYPALISRRDSAHAHDTAWKYPCSRSVLDEASLVVVHSNNTVDLARRWYGTAIAAKLRVVPPLRAPCSAGGDKAAIRKKLGFGADDLLVCAFGLVGPTKLNHELVKAWLASKLAKNPKCKLAFVGQNEPGGYGIELSRLIASANSSRISITGWTDAELFEQYLAIADIGVQLRTLSRGETSRTVLDCMKHGVPLIVNDHGDMANLAGDAAIVLTDDFDLADLTRALETLADAPARRSKLGANGVRKILTEHSPAACAQAYQAVLNSAHASDCVVERLLTSAAQVGLSQFEVAQFSSALAATIADDPPRLFVDVTVLARADAGTGIQRVVRNVLTRLLSSDFENLRVEPVFVDPEAAKFRFARSFTAEFLSVSLGSVTDEIVDFTERDTLLLLDLNPVLLRFVETEIARLKRQGVDIVSIVYDLLPIKHPEFFPDDAEQVHRDWLDVIAKGSSAVCISKAVASDLREYLEEHDPGAGLKVSHFRLGSELDGQNASETVRHPVKAGPNSCRSTTTFLMVGTVEPRKGYLDVLDAFEELWTQGEKVELCVVGKQGWKAHHIAERLRNLAAAGSLKWYKAVHDGDLEVLYRDADCLIAASVDEGFGLPLVEAAHRGLHLIARDIPVFHEVCGDAATYFSTNLTDILKKWLDQYRIGKAPTSEGVPHTTWDESVQALLREVFPEEILGIRT